uniref:NADH dehydrogenase subunit 6 n=1 Tax=Sphyraena borealis TaxID=372791 RepID=UPI0028FC8347|nr:NADH dehydrogenase subunit 6 [Sphyraena borealis]WNH37897.1 NADH dehydrogenase subunit 6 [Sphyraena borealis]
MLYSVCVLLICFVGGFVAVASNPSPYFGALGLVLVAGVGCGLLAGHGGCYLSLVLFLIYLGGMLVVFAYTAALASDLHPESWGNSAAGLYFVAYFLGMCLLALLAGAGLWDSSWLPTDESDDFSLTRLDIQGVSYMYSFGGWGLVITAWVLLVTLFVVFELTRGLGRGAMRAP